MTNMTYEFPGVLWDRLDEDQREETVAEFVDAGVIADRAGLIIAAGVEPPPRPPRLAAAIAARQKSRILRDPGHAIEECIQRCANRLESAYLACAAKCEDENCEKACDDKIEAKFLACERRCELGPDPH